MAERVARLDEAHARAIVALRTFERQGGGPLWTDDDRAWATRLARETVPADAAPERYLSERAQHALQRLAPRVPGLQRWLGHRVRVLPLAGGAALAGLVGGLLFDRLAGGSQRIDLLAPHLWLLVVWTAVVLAFGLWRAARRDAARDGGPGLLARTLQRLLTPGPASPALAQVLADWAALPGRAAGNGIALGLHSAAAGFGAGAIAGMYLRGLVLDFRAGWQSTFLETARVQRALELLLAPASALSGVAVPAVEPLRIVAEATPTGAAAPWMHLYAATIALFVVLPRAAAAAWTAARLAAQRTRVPLPLSDPYLQRLLRERGRKAAQVQVWPHGVALGPAATLALRETLLARFGADLQLRVAEASDYATEAPPPGPPDTVRVALFDLASTPEAEAQGRWLAALAAGAGELHVAVDEAAFARRFGALPERLEQRRAAWREFAARAGVPCEFVRLT